MGWMGEMDAALLLQLLENEGAEGDGRGDLKEKFNSERWDPSRGSNDLGAGRVVLAPGSLTLERGWWG